MVHSCCRNPKGLIALLLGLVLVLLCASGAMAADPSVSITVSKWAQAPLEPTDFEITQITLSSVNITWTMGTAANITIVRYSTSGYPFTVSDGSLAYSGNLTYVVVEDLNLDEYTYYFRAWSQNEYGTSTGYAQGSIGTEAEDDSGATTIGTFTFSLTGEDMGLLEMIFLIALIGFAFWKRGWIRVLLAICIIIWGAFVVQYDVKVAAPLLAIGTVLFIMGAMKLIQNYRMQEA